jgi:hypothetical protein
LKALVPLALADGTTLDAILARLFAAGAHGLTDAEWAEAVAVCGSQFTLARPWELGQWQ